MNMKPAVTVSMKLIRIRKPISYRPGRQYPSFVTAVSAAGSLEFIQGLGISLHIVIAIAPGGSKRIIGPCQHDIHVFALAVKSSK